MSFWNHCGFSFVLDSIVIIYILWLLVLPRTNKKVGYFLWRNFSRRKIIVTFNHSRLLSEHQLQSYKARLWKFEEKQKYLRNLRTKFFDTWIFIETKITENISIKIKLKPKKSIFNTRNFFPTNILRLSKKIHLHNNHSAQGRIHKSC